MIVVFLDFYPLSVSSQRTKPGSFLNKISVLGSYSHGNSLPKDYDSVKLTRNNLIQKQNAGKHQAIPRIYFSFRINHEIMNYQLESEILSSVQGLNRNQKTDILDYIKKIDSPRHSTRLYRRKAMKQIREALQEV